MVLRLNNYRAHVMKVAGVISRYLHVPVGVAVIIAIILVPKILAIITLLWYAIGLISARRLYNSTRPDEKGE